MFKSSVTVAKSVTVRVPSGATGYGMIPGSYTTDTISDNWGNAFRGKGWNRTTNAYGTGTVNGNITLTVEYVP
jgi:hypothetical protein